MAHGLTASDSMMSVHETPWHGLGVVLDQRPRSLEDAITASGLDWTVAQSPIHRHLTVDGWTVEQPVEGYRANVRADTGDVLASCPPTTRWCRTARRSRSWPT